MDLMTERLLRLWGLAQYVESFKDQEVDYEALLGLSENDLSKLFGGKLGPKGRFRRHMIEHFKKNISTQVTLQSASTSEIGLGTSNEKQHFAGEMKFEEVDMDLDDALFKDEPDDFHPLQEDPLVHCKLEGVTNSQSIAQDMFPGQSSVLLSQPGSPTKDSEVNRKISYAPTTSSDTTTYDSESHMSASPEIPTSTSKRWSSKRRLHPSRESSSIPPLKRTIVDGKNIVEHYLSHNCIGRAVLQFKGKPVRLDPATQAKLVHEVVVSEIGPDGQRLISGNRFTELSELIVSLFPKECKSKYFIPRVPANESTPALPPRGLLYDKYHNLLKFLRKVGIRNSTRKMTDQASIAEEEISEDTVRDILWLESHSLESESITREKWRKTVQSRIFELRNGVDPVFKRRIGRACMHSYMRRFSCLSQKWGLDLLLEDFEFLYEGKYIPLVKNWPNIYSKMLILAKNKRMDVPKNIVACLQLIPKLFKQPILIHTSRGRTKEVWRPNVLESTYGFLLHVEVISDLEIMVQRLKIKCKNVNKPLLPFPAVVGPSEYEIKDSFIVIDKHWYHMESPLAAFDTCFKVYHALHCGYPCQSSYAWLFVQRAFYGLKTKWDFSVPSVECYVEAYQEINNKQILFG